MNDLQRLAVAQAVFKVVGSAVSTKDPNSLRAAVDERAERDYRFDGVKSRDVIMPDGTKVGTYSVKVTPAVDYQPAQYVEVAACESPWKLDSWMKQRSFEELQLVARFAVENADMFAAFWLDQVGELPDGCELMQQCVSPAVDAKPMRYAGTVLKVDERAVAESLAGELPAAVAALLTDGEVE